MDKTDKQTIRATKQAFSDKDMKGLVLTLGGWVWEGLQTRCVTATDYCPKPGTNQLSLICPCSGHSPCVFWWLQIWRFSDFVPTLISLGSSRTVVSKPVTIPWYRLHLVTCIAVLLLAYCCLDASYWGWPLQYTGDASLPLRRLIGNAIAAFSSFLLILGTTVFIELVIRRDFTRLQFTLAAMLVLCTVCAIMLAELVWAGAIAVHKYDLEPSNLFMDIPFWISVPISLAKFCTLFATISLALQACRWCYTRCVGR